MPEGVEIEYYRRAADRAIGREIASIDASDTWFTKEGTTQESLDDALVGEIVIGTRRIGKLLILELGNGARLGLRFGMTGRILVDGKGPIEYLEYSSKRNETAWDRFTMFFADGGDLRIRDPRRLGGVILEPDEGALGPDAFTVAPKHFRTRVAVGPVAIKARLLDQSRVAGIGNLIADETLWRSGIDPARQAGDLSDNEVKKLHRHLKRVLADFVRDGGSHSGKLQASRVRGGCCPRCGQVLDRREVGGRTTFSCPHHQA